MQVVEELRPSFWNAKVSGKLERKLPWGHPELTVDMLTEQLGQAEILIENFQRLEGYELELRSMRLSVSEWEALVPAEELEQHGFAVIVDSARLEL